MVIILIYLLENIFFIEAVINKDLECYEGLYFIHFLVGFIGF